MSRGLQRIALEGAAIAALVTGAAGCSEAMYGTGKVYVWNGTDKAVAVKIDGRSPQTADVPSQAGQLFDEVVAGPYTFTADADSPQVGPVVQDRLTIFNIRAAGCFARGDVTGMYQRGKAPVRVLELYKGSNVIAVGELVQIPPGERLPSEAPRSDFGVQRLAVVPCTMVEEPSAEIKIAEHMRRMR